MNSLSENCRYERKFIITDPSMDSFDHLRFYLPWDLYEAYPSRRINSIYYDTTNLLLAHQSREGYSNRFKVRIRYYGKSFALNNPYLEIKYKIGGVGFKQKFYIDKNKLIENNFSLSYLLNNLNLPSAVNNLIPDLKPIVFISYKRSYYLENFERFRFTFDRSLSFNYIFNPIIYFPLKFDNLVNFHQKVLEIKYSEKHEPDINLLTKDLPIRLTNFSKYRISLSELGIFHL